MKQWWHLRRQRKVPSSYACALPKQPFQATSDFALKVVAAVGAPHEEDESAGRNERAHCENGKQDRVISRARMRME